MNVAAPIRIVESFTLYFFTIHHASSTGKAMPMMAFIAIITIELVAIISIK